MASYEGLFNQAMSALGFVHSHSKINPTEDSEVMRRYLGSEIMRLRLESEVLSLRQEVRELGNDDGGDGVD